MAVNSEPDCSVMTLFLRLFAARSFSDSLLYLALVIAGSGHVLQLRHIIITGLHTPNVRQAFLTACLIPSTTKQDN